MTVFLNMQTGDMLGLMIYRLEN